MLFHIGGDNQAVLKEVQALGKGMLLTDMLVSGLCEIELGAFCLQRALGWSWAPRVGGHASRILPAVMALRAAIQNWVYKEMLLSSTTALLPQSPYKQESWNAERSNDVSKVALVGTWRCPGVPPGAMFRGSPHLAVYGWSLALLEEAQKTTFKHQVFPYCGKWIQHSGEDYTVEIKQFQDIGN